MAPAKPPSEVPKEERIQEAIQEFLKAEKAYEEVGGDCKRPSCERIARSYGLEPSTLGRRIKGKTKA